MHVGSFRFVGVLQRHFDFAGLYAILLFAEISSRMDACNTKVSAPLYMFDILE